MNELSSTPPCLHSEKSTEGNQHAAVACNSRRSLWVDVARVWATWMIVVYHMPCSRFEVMAPGGSWGEWCKHLNLPTTPLFFFFFVSGYFSSSDVTWRNRWQRVAKLFICYVVWNFVFAWGLRDEISIARVFAWGGGVCADYPLWYVWALILLTLVAGVFRRVPYVLLILYGVFYWWDNSWHCALGKYMALPSPQAALVFAVGGWCHRFSLAALKTFFLRTGILWIILIAWPVSSFCSDVAITALFIAGCCALSAMLPSCAKRMAALAPASFLCFATHAGTIWVISCVVGKLDAESLRAPWVIWATPFVAYMGAAVAYELMKRYAPALLPPLAYSGRWRFGIFSDKHSCPK